MALEYATVLASCLPSVDAVETSLYEALERTGNRPVRALQRLRAVLFTAEQAKLLKAQEKDAGLLVERVGFLKDGRAVEFSQSFYRGDIYDFVAELSASVMSLIDSRMYREAAQAPARRARAARDERGACARIGALLREMKPRAVVTCARGSSDHAATFAKYLIESRTKVLTSSAAPSLSSLYDAQPDLRGVVFLAISQSGKSPDLLASAEAAKRGGALVIALCNSTDSPLAALADHLVPLCAGVESSVAATKSYIASLSAIVHLVASWTEDRALLDALLRAPDQLEQAWKLDWSAARAGSAAMRRTCSSSVAASASGIAQEARSSSRKPAACTPKRSAPRK